MAEDYAGLFLAAKRAEGLSERTLHYYGEVLGWMAEGIKKGAPDITSADLRGWLAAYRRGAAPPCKATLNNMRRVLSSFFGWLEAEGHIEKSPSRRVRSIKAGKAVREALTESMVGDLSRACKNSRDRAIVGFLASSGVRVGELVMLDRGSVDLDERECVVLGKGNKERAAYFSEGAAASLKAYLNGRADGCPALFAGLRPPWRRLSAGAVGAMLRALGRRCGIPKVHPHAFRRHLATRAAEEGMPIEQIQRLLGHSSIGTTMIYVNIAQARVKESHRRLFSKE